MGIGSKFLIVLTILALVSGVFVVHINSAKASLYFLKEFIIKPLVRKLANALANKLINRVNGLITGLNQRTPSFITNWRNYTLDSQARGDKVFRSVLADTKLCPYLKNKTLTVFGAEKYLGAIKGAAVKVGGVPVFQNETNIQGLPSFQFINNCTLDPTLNINNFKTDFNKGGWAAWDQLIKPQNNFLGIYNSALSERQSQIQTDLQSARDYSIAGQGFLGQKLGINNAASPTGCAGAAFKDTGGALTIDTPCFFMGKEVTPARLLGDTAANGIDDKLRQVGGAQELTDVLLNLLNAVMNSLSNKILNFAGLGSYNPPSFVPLPTPPGGGTFNETPIDTTGDPNAGQFNNSATCRQACGNDREACLAAAGQSCTTDPITGIQTCQKDPTATVRCQSDFDQCVLNCP